MKIAMRSLLAAVVALGFVAGAVAPAGDEKKDEKNLAANGGFEDVKDGAPTGWSSVCSEGGTVTHKAVAEGAKDGKYCLSMKSKAEWAVAYSPKVKIDRTKTYTLTGFAKVKAGKATIKIDYYNGDEYLGNSESDVTANDAWTSLKAVSELDNFKEATHLLVAGVVHGDGEALFDKFELTAK
jgi:Carbohydrate binding domain